MRHTFPSEVSPHDGLDQPLSSEAIVALQEACGPVGRLRFPSPDIIRSLRQQGYIEIVLGGVQITPLGLERLIRERNRVRAPEPKQQGPSVS